MKRLITIITMAASTAVAMAQQERAEQLFDQFINDTTYSGCVKNFVNYSSSEDGSMTQRNESYTFALPLEWSDKVEALAQELGKLQPSAYNIFMRRAGSNDKAKTNIVVERGNHILLGAHADRNYMALFFHSATDTLRRYVYAMAWYEDAYEKSVKGSLYKIYGLDPARKTTTVRTMRKIYINGQEIDLGDADALREMGLNVNEFNKIVSVGGSTNGSSSITIVKNEARARQAEETAKKIETIQETTASVQTSTEFISEFKNLHDLFMAVQGDYTTTQKFQSTILSRMDNMAKEKGDLLTMKEERTLCIEMLKEMRKYTRTASDKVMTAHVDLVIKRLK